MTTINGVTRLRTAGGDGVNLSALLGDGNSGHGNGKAGEEGGGGDGETHLDY